MKARTQQRPRSRRGGAAPLSRSGRSARSGSRQSAQPRSRRMQARASSASRARSGKPSGRSRSRARSRQAASPGRRSGAKSNRTRDHEQIQRWVEARGGHPAIVKRTAKGKGAEGGVLRIDFPGFSGAGTLKAVSWDEWFDVFDDRNLEFLYQEKAANGKSSRFNKLVCPQ